MEFPIGDDYSEGGDISDGLDFHCVSKHIRRIGEFPIGNACFSMTRFNLLIPISLIETQNDTLDIGVCIRLVRSCLWFYNDHRSL